MIALMFNPLWFAHFVEIMFSHLEVPRIPVFMWCFFSDQISESTGFQMLWKVNGKSYWYFGNLAEMISIPNQQETHPLRYVCDVILFLCELLSFCFSFKFIYIYINLYFHWSFCLTIWSQDLAISISVQEKTWYSPRDNCVLS